MVTINRKGNSRVHQILNDLYSIMQILNDLYTCVFILFDSLFKFIICLYIIFCRGGFNIEIKTRHHEQEGSELSIVVELSTDKRKVLYKFQEEK